MILLEYNLMENKNGYLDYKYGVIISGYFVNYPITILDNSTEVVNGKYTRDFSTVLIHLSERIRIKTHMRIFDDFLYQNSNLKLNPSTYKMYDYKFEKLSNEQIINDLRKILYFLQPNLREHSCVGWDKTQGIEKDVNYYEGTYILNDEEEYTILKNRDTFKIYKGVKSYYPNWKNKEDLIYTEKIDFDLCKLALNYHDIKRKIVLFPNQFLDEKKIFL